MTAPGAAPRDLVLRYLRTLPLPHFSPAVELGRSPIAGTGLLARRAIDEGEILVVERGPTVDTALVDLVYDLTGYECETRVGWGKYLLHRPPHEDHQGGYLNHSCAPNIGMLENGVWCAIRPIAAGEEVLCDYGTFETTRGWSMPCRCGAPNCRGVITARDFRLPQLREALGRWFAPYLRCLAEEEAA